MTQDKAETRECEEERHPSSQTFLSMVLPNQASVPSHAFCLGLITAFTKGIWFQEWSLSPITGS